MFMKYGILLVYFYHSKLNGNIVVGFYCEENDKIKTLNLFISFVAFRIYKYKMLCRLDSLNETAYNLYNHVRNLFLFIVSCIIIRSDCHVTSRCWTERLQGVICTDGRTKCLYMYFFVYVCI